MDRTTGRFYYIDHNTHSTHWNPPTSLLQYQQHFAGQSNPLEVSKLPAGPGQPIPQYLSGHHGSSAHVQQPLPQVPPSRPSPPSNSNQEPSSQSSNGRPTPPITSTSNVSSQPTSGQPTSGQPTSGQSSPSVPSEKPHPVVTPHIDRANKPKAVQPMPVEVYRQKILNLQPVKGGRVNLY